ncbi:MAG: hypothetical protein EOO73_31925 [Myxococcales bacterium]|nr:MAG: hypothetical protein EOO73_31925 [Myxococcales bacterium]
MSLTDVVSSLNLTIFAEVPLLVFFGIFVGLCLSMLRGEDRLQQSALLPLREERPRTRRLEP